MEQNFTSVAGRSVSTAGLTIAELNLAAGTNVGVAATGEAVDVADLAACAPPDEETAFNSPPLPVDFSALVAPSVRR